MDKDRIKGKIDEIKGDIKERIGGATKDRSTQAEGWAENKKGKVQEKIGELKDEMRKDDDPAHRRDPDDM